MSFRNFILLVALMSLASCGSGTVRSMGSEARIGRGGPSEAIRLDPQASAQNFSLPVPVQDAWDALWAAYRSLEIPITAQDADKYTVENTGVRMRRIDGRRMSEFFTCGESITGSIADTYQVTVVVHTALEAESESTTTLYTVVDASAESRETRSGDLHCESRGRLEQLIADRVTSMLPPRR